MKTIYIECDHELTPNELKGIKETFEQLELLKVMSKEELAKRMRYW